MSKHNYSQYSNKNKPNHTQNNTPNRNVQQRKPEPVKPVETVEPVKPVLVQETVHTVTLPTMVKGVVAHCSKLNVREKPIINSSIVCILDATSEIEIDISKSTENWFYIQSAIGAKGYCMKEYIDAHL